MRTGSDVLHSGDVLGRRAGTVAHERGGLERRRPAGDSHRDRQRERGQAQRGQGDRRRGVGSAGLISDSSAFGRSDPRHGRPGQRDDLQVLGPEFSLRHVTECMAARTDEGSRELTTGPGLVFALISLGHFETAWASLDLMLGKR
jgi:hypothetical protein